MRRLPQRRRRAAPIKIGPPLWGVVGRDIASVEGFAYSDALRGKEGQWTYENLYEFIHGPKEWAPGTKMAFAGIKEPRGPGRPPGLSAHARGSARAAAREAAAEASRVRSRRERASPPAAASSAPARAGRERGEAGQQTAAAEPAAPAASPGLERAGAETWSQTAAVGAGTRRAAAPAGAAGAPAWSLCSPMPIPTRGAKDAEKCAACHSFDEGGSAKIGPPLWGVVGRDIASVEGFAYSDALAGKEGAWDYQNLDAFLAEPRIGRRAPRWPSPASRSPRSAPT